jgi:hypothetical protein
MGRSLAQRSPTECVVSECDLESSEMRPRPLGLSSHVKNRNDVRVIFPTIPVCSSVSCIFDSFPVHISTEVD